MEQKSQGVSLREILRHAFASIPAEGKCDHNAQAVAPTIVPFERTSSDRSRMKQKVLEELARRREQAQSNVKGAKVAPFQPKQSEDTLFGGIEDDAPRRLTDQDNRVCISMPRIHDRSRMDVRELVAAAYGSLMRRLPEDHVVLNPMANAEFIVRCRELGATVPEVLLNRTLLNNRKAGRHADVERQLVQGLSVGTFDQIGHAVEMAASLVQREWVSAGQGMPSIDDILCGPELRLRFRKFVTAFHASVDIVDCHLVLLAFRKSGPESAKRLACVVRPHRLLSAPFSSLDPEDVPEGCGIYRVLCKRRPIFVSGTANLRQRLRKHLACGKGGFWSDQIPFRIDGNLSVEVFPGPSNWLPRRADAVARSMRIEDYPDLNWREKGAMFATESRVVPRLAAVC